MVAGSCVRRAWISDEDAIGSYQQSASVPDWEQSRREKTENTEVYRSERFVGRFQRTVTLPAPIAVDKVKADYKDGILTITLPKTEEAKPKQIDVQVA